VSGDASLPDPAAVWNVWNATHREESQSQVSLEQADVIEGWLAELAESQRRDILEVGCGTGWMSDRLSAFGQVTAIDVADEIVERARARHPQIMFVAADFLTAVLPTGGFDVVVSLETMAHIEDQVAFLDRVAALLRPGGRLMLATQNRPIMERNIANLPSHGWYRRWVDHTELRELVAVQFDIEELRSITPKFFTGPLHVLNSAKLYRLTDRLRLSWVLRSIKRFEEDRFLGWTLMCRATKKPTVAAKPA
jgi:SAM-dependent methyltransferase